MSTREPFDKKQDSTTFKELTKVFRHQQGNFKVVVQTKLVGGDIITEVFETSTDNTRIPIGPGGTPFALNPPNQDDNNSSPGSTGVYDTPVIQVVGSAVVIGSGIELQNQILPYIQMPRNTKLDTIILSWTNVQGAQGGSYIFGQQSDEAWRFAPTLFRAIDYRLIISNNFSSRSVIQPAIYTRETFISSNETFTWKNPKIPGANEKFYGDIANGVVNKGNYIGIRWWLGGNDTVTDFLTARDFTLTITGKEVL